MLAIPMACDLSSKQRKFDVKLPEMHNSLNESITFSFHGVNIFARHELTPYSLHKQ
jgi:hypothetical protein